ncbi:MAG: hypothetical protein IPL86_01995 [Flavobacteriales bacterium]|nr:hypothetical protein [Flavobacteriales bacterium]
MEKERTAKEHFAFRTIPQEELNDLLVHREGEEKLGEHLAPDWRAESCRYVLLGISETSGPAPTTG